MAYRTLGNRVQKVQALDGLPDLRGKVVVVTGGTDGVGRALVEQVAMTGAAVVLTARTREKGERVRDEIREQTGNPAVDLVDLDLADLRSVRAGAEQLLERYDMIDVLICNAAHQGGDAVRRLTADGFEMTFGVNHVGHFLLVRLLEDRLAAAAPSRIAIIASEAHKRARGGLDFDDLMLAGGTYSRSRAYNRSKLANMLFARALSRRLAERGVTVNAVHPGGVDTPMMRATMKGIGARAYPFLQRHLFITPHDAAAGVLRVALDPALEHTTRQYFELGAEHAPTSAAQDDTAAERLWTITENLVASADGNKSAPSASTAALRLDAREAQAPVSQTLFGIFVEDLNFGCDGGLNANAVNNYSFDVTYFERKPLADLTTILTHRPVHRVPDRLRHWTVTGGALASRDDDAVVRGGYYGQLDAHGRAVLSNAGYPGDRPGIAVRRGTAHLFRTLVRTHDFTGDLEVRLVDGSGHVLASDRGPVPGDGWQQLAATLRPTRSALGALELVFHGSGRVDIDEVVLVPEDHWGAGDPRWSQGVLRRDLVESLRALRPGFVRFPGGCIVEGLGNGNAYQWKDTVGPLHQRVGDANLWGLRRTDGDYWQSMQIGFYEYFLLCEDLGAQPMPIVNAGLSCQGRTNERVALPSAAFDALVQDVLDLVDWATGDPTSNRWAAVRAEAGHPEPFGLEYLGIGNENFGPEYLERFDLIKAAVDAHKPGITTILSAGAAPSGKHFDTSWAHARDKAPDVLVDEHFYMPRRWVTKAANRYDDYPRGGPQVFLGEYAASLPTLLPAQERLPTNTFGSALAEAAFLTGVERNSDVVAMTCYAPLFALAENAQWFHNLIPFSPTDVLLTPNYYVQQLFATTLGERIVPSRGALPDGVFASSTSTATQQYVKVVNSSARVVTVEIDLPAVSAGPVRMTTLHAELEARNTLPFDGPPTYRVRPVDSTVEIDRGRLLLTLPRHSIVSLAAPLAAGAG